MSIMTDSQHQPYIELALDGGGYVRMTQIDPGWAGEPTVRIQIRDSRTGQLRLGPEIPRSMIPDTLRALAHLAMHTG